MENIQNLTNAIIIQAGRDYLEYGRKLKRLLKTDTRNMSEKEIKRFEKKVKKARANFKEVKRFFYSEWYCLLSGAASKAVINRLEKEVDYI